ncbi:MAG TPA: hypothetical protein VGI88_07305 [Verrucomicrobiae bacterium]
MTINEVCTSTNSTGLLKEIVRNINLIDDCAVEDNLTNLDNLSLVFNPTNFSVEVVDTNGMPVCTNLSFPGGLTNLSFLGGLTNLSFLSGLTNLLGGGLTFTNIITNVTQTAGNITEIVFQRNVLVETNLIPTGVISGFASWVGTNMSSFKLTANLLYTELANGTNGPEICVGTLRVGGNPVGGGGNPFGDQDQDESGNHGKGNHGNNGLHLGLQNPLNPHSGH